MDWSAEATEMFDKLMGEVPVAFRAMAKAQVEKFAEDIAEERGADQVTEDDVVRGQIKATPPFQKAALTAALEKLGIDQSKFADML